ncbi:indoleamine 2,3-dioxygenase 2 isoform X2 [Paramuricea clavata]|uniref:Indoleamine 2,3-dioxygenase 2 isoform X2 n=1 Tax=Paramuricea clavata TaxID=317549 RepID=A0A7D9DB65_PARCT|nr:indoleamine 2,3-dioxygenase 2 isoform X2 [Paramuricea clavata]
MKTSLKRIYEHCDPAFFYTKLRVFLSGWKNSKSLPDGIIYEGVSTKPLKFSGASGSQSTTFHVFDAVLGIVHSRKGGEKSFLDFMLDYMPRGHRKFVLNVRKGPSVRNYVERSESDELLKIYNDCVDSVVQFRSFHIQVVTRYVTIQATKEKKHNEPVKNKLVYGTGGTEYMSFLKRVRSETSEVKIS